MAERPDRPYVLLSAAMSADGYIDDASGQRLVLSDDADLDRVDELRARSDAILVGAQTIRSDNPRLLVRSAARRQRRSGHGLSPSPLKVTITGTGDLDPAARFFTEAHSLPLVYAGTAAAGQLRPALGGVATVLPVPGPGRRVNLQWVLADLAGRGIGTLMVEGGASVLGQFLAAGLADELQLAVAPVFVGDPSAPRLLSGGVPPGRMLLAGVARAGDMAVLSYRPDRRDRGEVWPTR